MEKWEGCVAVVTGANVGIGYSLTNKFIKLGIKVVGMDILTENMKNLADKLNEKEDIFYPMQVDIRDEEAVVTAFSFIKKYIGPISILINNAGILETSNLIDGDAEVWKNTLGTNVFGLCLCTREAVNSMRESNIRGHIIHMNSICGHIIPKIDNFNVYPASKYAVTALTESLRRELNKIKAPIKISSISPGIVKTKMMEKKLETDPKYKNMYLPLLNSEDIVDAIIYVLSTPPHVQVHELIIKPLHEDV